MSKRWPGARRPVLDELDLELRPGEVVQITGANGAGKTTLLRIVCGLLDPDGGGVRVHGRDATRHRSFVREHVSYLSAGSTAVYTRLTVRQHLELWARTTYVPRPERARRIRGLLAAFDLQDLEHRRLDRLSSGQRQRVRLALAFLPTADVLLLDEPTTSLDDGGRRRLAAALGVRVATGSTALVCSPDESGALVASRRFALDRGRLLAR